MKEKFWITVVVVVVVVVVVEVVVVVLVVAGAGAAIVEVELMVLVATVVDNKAVSDIFNEGSEVALVKLYSGFAQVGKNVLDWFSSFFSFSDVIFDVALLPDSFISGELVFAAVSVVLNSLSSLWVCN
jgi:hypothetical protein